jgi:hypothetical protein
MPIIPITWKAEIGGLWFEASPDKKLLRPYLKVQAGHGGSYLLFLLCRRWR